MIRPISFTNPNVTFKSYSSETAGLLRSTENLFDNISIMQMADDIKISRECGDLDLVKHLDNKSISLSKFGEGNLILQVADKATETVDVFYHNVSNELSDRVYTYADTNLFPWNRGRDMKTSSKFVSSMSMEEKGVLELMCKKYIPEFLKLVENFRK